MSVRESTLSSAATPVTVAAGIVTLAESPSASLVNLTFPLSLVARERVTAWSTVSAFTIASPVTEAILESAVVWAASAVDWAVAAFATPVSALDWAFLTAVSSASKAFIVWEAEATSLKLRVTFSPEAFVIVRRPSTKVASITFLPPS